MHRAVQFDLHNNLCFLPVVPLFHAVPQSINSPLSQHDPGIPAVGYSISRLVIQSWADA